MNEQTAPRGPRGGNSGMSIPPGADLDYGYATDDWPMTEVTAMTEHHDENQPVANPNRTVVDDDHETAEERAQDQQWSDVADEVKEAVEHAGESAPDDV